MGRRQRRKLLEGLPKPVSRRQRDRHFRNMGHTLRYRRNQSRQPSACNRLNINPTANASKTSHYLYQHTKKRSIQKLDKEVQEALSGFLFSAAFELGFVFFTVTVFLRFMSKYAAAAVIVIVTATATTRTTGKGAISK